MEELLEKIAQELAAQNKLNALILAKEIGKRYIDADFMKGEQYISALNISADKMLEIVYSSIKSWISLIVSLTVFLLLLVNKIHVKLFSS